MDGFNLFKRTLEISENKEVTHFFFGNKEEVVKKIINKFENSNPNTQIIGYVCPPYLEIDELLDEKYIKEIIEIQPSIVWVSLGFPKQELFINDLLNKYVIDDVVGAIPVHLAAGVWGTLAVGFFSDLEILGTDLSRLEQIKIQFIGVVAIGLFAFVGSFTILKILNIFYPLRVSPIQEELGLNIAEHNATSVEHDLISILDKQSETGDLTIRGPQDPFTAGGVIGL